jgi:TonB-linked SusC/RagA family outer membrane protein
MKTANDYICYYVVHNYIKTTKPMKLLFTLFAGLLMTVSVFAQTDLLVTGKVLDDTGSPMPGTNVILKGTSIGVSTDANGDYSLSIPSGRTDAILMFSFIGYEPQEVVVGTHSTINVTLNADVQSLSEVVVIGYSEQSKARITAAVSKMKPDELKNTTNPNPVHAMQGKIAGVSIPISSGQPGQGATNIIIRGSSKLNAYGTSIGNSNGEVTGSGTNKADDAGPLVVIDGVFRSMDDINSDDIESLQVMKDAASTAIYGARGANGVIVIKTKTGKFNSGKPNVTFNYRTTVETPSRQFDYMSAKDYLVLARTTMNNTYDALPKDNVLNNGGFSAGTRVYTAPGQYGNGTNLTALYDNIVAIEGQAYVDNLLANGWQTIDDPINPGTTLLFADNNYQDLLWNTGSSNTYNIGIDGGGEVANYNLSMNYVDQAGTFAGTGYKRYSALSNIGIKASEKLKLNLMLNYQNVLPNYVEEYQNELVRATRITPLLRIYKDNGQPTLGENVTTRNRFHTLAYDNVKISTERIVSRLEADLEIIKGLHYRPSLSYLIQDYREAFFRKAFPDPIQFSTQRQKREEHSNSRQLMVDQIVQYDFKLPGLHEFFVLGGFNFTRETVNGFKLATQRATNDYIETINEPSVGTVGGATVTNVTDLETTVAETRSLSYFGQLNYNFDGKYMLSGTIRYDGFSNFAPQNKFALFPSVSAGWNVHREGFWNVSSVSALKLRASFGGAGLPALKITDTYGNYKAVSYAQGSGILRENLSNPNLKWEATETTDLGLDVGLLKDRITVSVDYYNKLTKNRLDLLPLSSEAPFASIVYNNGTLRNRGVEIELGATVLNVKGFSWKTSIVFAYNQQMITELPDNGRLNNRQKGGVVYDVNSGQEIEVGGLAEGERPYGLYAFKPLGVFATEAEALEWGKVDNLASAAGKTVGKHAGDYIWKDLNNDDIIDARDMEFIGYRTPNRTGGMQNTFSYRNFTMRFNMDFALGHVINDGNLARSLGQGRAYNEGAPVEALGDEIWQKEGDTGKKYARFSFADYDFGQRNYLRQVPEVGVNSSYGVDVATLTTKGDFLAFREVYLGYDLPKVLAQRIKLAGVTVFASVFNLGYITKYKGLNPETYTGFDPGGYPRPRQFTFGANIKI